MVTIRICGGLGNQLFTYACGYAVSKRLKCELAIDISDYKNGYFRGYMLDYFKLDECKKIEYRYINNKIGRQLMKFALKIKYSFVEEKADNVFQNDVFNIKCNSYLYGYWQSEKYFEAFSNDIKRQIKPKEMKTDVLEFIERTNKINSIAVHIRRGDYVNCNWTLNTDYYFKAIEFMNRNVKNPIFFFFSDDLEWTKKKFGDNPAFEYVEFSNDLNDLDEFWCMSNCKNFIIANSTFSWWAAWLNENRNKKVVAPHYGKWSGDYYPKEWKLMKATMDT